MALLQARSLLVVYILSTLIDARNMAIIPEFDDRWVEAEGAVAAEVGGRNGSL